MTDLSFARDIQGLALKVMGPKKPSVSGKPRQPCGVVGCELSGSAEALPWPQLAHTTMPRAGDRVGLLSEWTGQSPRCQGFKYQFLPAEFAQAPPRSSSDPLCARLQQFMLISDLIPDKCLFLFLNCILFFKKSSPIIYTLCLKTPDLPLGLGQGSYPRTWELVRSLSCPELFRSRTHIPRAFASPRKMRHINVSMARLGTFFGWTLRFLFLVQSL